MLYIKKVFIRPIQNYRNWQRLGSLDSRDVVTLEGLGAVFLEGLGAVFGF